MVLRERVWENGSERKSMRKWFWEKEYEKMVLREGVRENNFNEEWENVILREIVRKWLREIVRINYFEEKKKMIERNSVNKLFWWKWLREIVWINHFEENNIIIERSSVNKSFWGKWENDWEIVLENDFERKREKMNNSRGKVVKWFWLKDVCLSLITYCASMFSIHLISCCTLSTGFRSRSSTMISTGLEYYRYKYERVDDKIMVKD